jgi:hypothetical protein
MLADDLEGTRHWGQRAMTFERLERPGHSAHALNNVGTVEMPPIRRRRWTS